jgi:hypothetical protein
MRLTPTITVRYVQFHVNPRLANWQYEEIPLRGATRMSSAASLPDTTDIACGLLRLARSRPRRSASAIPPELDDFAFRLDRRNDGAIASPAQSQASMRNGLGAAASKCPVRVARHAGANARRVAKDLANSAHHAMTGTGQPRVVIVYFYENLRSRTGPSIVRKCAPSSPVPQAIGYLC